MQHSVSGPLKVKKIQIKNGRSLGEESNSENIIRILKFEEF